MTHDAVQASADTAPMTSEDIHKHLMFHVKHEALADLEAFRKVLVERNEVMNLIGPATVPHYWSRHVLDSAQLLNHAPGARVWTDLGAGAGFPGIVLAILLKHTDREATNGATQGKVYLIDSLTKRCKFLNEVVTALNLPAEVINDRAENFRLNADVLTARAFAPFDRLFTFSHHLFRDGAEGWFLKGETVETELEAAKKDWRFEAEIYPSLSDPRGRVVHIRRLKRVR
jgi:16S rRNA (guanine527-N7)-methyltransferase